MKLCCLFERDFFIGIECCSFPFLLAFFASWSLPRNTLCDTTSPRQVGWLRFFCRFDMSHEFKSVWICVQRIAATKFCLSENDFRMSHEAICCDNQSRRHDAAICRIVCPGLHTCNTNYIFSLFRKYASLLAPPWCHSSPIELKEEYDQLWKAFNIYRKEAF